MKFSAKALLLSIAIIIFIYLFFVLSAQAQEKQCPNCKADIQIASFCAGQHPPKANWTEKEVNANADKINFCNDVQLQYHGKLIQTYSVFIRTAPGLDQAYNKCARKAYDPHYMNMLKFYSCVKDYIVDLQSS
jgi:hypothetical protein